MNIVPRRDPLVLLVGDVAAFTIALWVTLALRHLAFPTQELFTVHFVPFSILFAVWVFVFFLAGLYGRYTRILRVHLPGTIFYTQTVNIALAALFFFVIPYFGITPKTVLAIYLVVSALCIYAWRIYLFPLIRPLRRMRAIIIGHGPDAEHLYHEVNADNRYPITFTTFLNTNDLPEPEVIQRLCRVNEDGEETTVIVADTSDKTMPHIFPIIYDVTFLKKHFIFVDLKDLYESVFDRTPLSLVDYEWILARMARSNLYDVGKRAIDIVFGLIGTLVTFAVLYPLVALLIKMTDAGPVLISQERLGRYLEPIHIYKFRSMSGVDEGNDVLKSKHTVTWVGRLLRRLHLDEFPQFWNLLRGNLSLVGPRPEFPVLARRYAARLPHYNARCLITPGLTGWARIGHHNDPHHGLDMQETREKLAYDLYYLANRSFIFDTYIIFQTLRFILIARGK